MKLLLTEIEIFSQRKYQIIVHWPLT